MLTVYGIETLPVYIKLLNCFSKVATVLTVYGIETQLFYQFCFFFSIVATVLTVYGIETYKYDKKLGKENLYDVATVLTVYGIETSYKAHCRLLRLKPLQQCLPFTVLKHIACFIICIEKYSCNSAYRLRY